MTSKEEMQQLRIKIATDMCVAYPKLTELILQKKPLLIGLTKDEKIRFKILQDMTKLEPSIKHILEYYIKRNS